MPSLLLSRTALPVLMLICGLAAFLSTSGTLPALAGGVPVTAAPSTAAPSTAAPAVAGGLAVQAARAEPDVADELTPRALGALARVEPALRRTGTTSDGWATYRLATGRVPDRLAAGAGFRGEISWVQGSLVRKARFYVPRSAAAAAPLLVSLHGLGSSLHKVEAQQRWSALAFQQRFVLVWGAGYKGSWNAGPCCGAAVRENIDDLGYLDRMLQITAALHVVDRRRVHLAGFSNGAMLAYRYACGRPGRIAGVLAVAGTLAAPCTPGRPTAVLAVHGAQDPTVPLAGTRYSRELRSPLPPARRAAQLWARTGAGVRTVVLPRFGHGWPTPGNGGYDTTGEGWKFLKAHPKPR